jgi:TonB family protein
LSLLLHGGITGLAIYAALHHPPAQTVNVLTIRLAPMTPANSAQAKPAQPAPAPVPKIQEPKPVVETPKPVAAPAKPEKNTAPPSPFGKSPKKAATNIAPPPPPAATTTGIATGVADVPIGSAGVTGIEGDFPYTLYIERMKGLIGTHWFRPQVASGAAVTIYFEIQRDGTIRNVKPEASSGSTAADRAAQRAILESSPLPPLPFGYNGTFLGVHLTFK